MILMLAQGRSYVEIQERLQTTAPTLSRWKKRFLEERINGLIEARHPGRKPTVITAQLQARVLEATRRKPKDGSTHWSCRKLARELGISKDTVHRVWRKAGLRPHRLERYMASDDPDFESKAADIIGLYLHPPQHAAVFCVDEKVSHPSFGPSRPCSSAFARTSREAWVRVLSPRDFIALCRLRRPLGQGPGQNGRTSHQRRICQLLGPSGRRLQAQATDSYHCG